jgi:hypothetical protein
MAWVEAPDVRAHLEGCSAWKWVADQVGDRRVVLDAIPRGFSRDRKDCAGVWFFPLFPPSPPATKTQKGPPPKERP